MVYHVFLQLVQLITVFLANLARLVLPAFLDTSLALIRPLAPSNAWTQIAKPVLLLPFVVIV